MQTGTSVRVWTTAATFEAGETALQYSGDTRRTVWFKWTAPNTGSFVVTTEGSDFDTLLGVYDEAPGATGFADLSNVRATMVCVRTLQCMGFLSTSSVGLV